MRRVSRAAIVTTRKTLENFVAESISYVADSNERDTGDAPRLSVSAISYAESASNWPVIWVRPSGIGSMNCGALMALVSRVNAVCRPMFAAV